MSSQSSAIETTVVSPASAKAREQIAEVWKFRELLYFFMWRDLKVRYKQTVIGVAWALLQPFVMMLIFTFVFGRLGRISSGGIPYPVFYYSALLPWTYFTASVNSATSSLVANQSVVKKVYLPRLILPLTPVLAGFVDFAVGLLLLAGLLLFHGITPGVSLAFAPLFLGLGMITALTLAIWSSALNAAYRDVRYAIPLLLLVWFFASPVIYPSHLVPAAWRTLYRLNPMASVIEGFRWSVTGIGRSPGVLIPLISAGVVMLLLLAGLAYFRRSEATIADLI